MEYENRKRQQKGIFLLVCGAVAVISLIFFPVSESVRKVASMPITIIPNNTIEKNKTGVNNPVIKNGLIVNKNPIYQASGWSLGLTGK
jgi:hypothetical protein